MQKHVLLIPRAFFCFVFWKITTEKGPVPGRKKRFCVNFALFFCPSARFWVAQRKQAREEGEKQLAEETKRVVEGVHRHPYNPQARINVKELHSRPVGRCQDASAASKLAPEVLCLPEEEEEEAHKTRPPHLQPSAHLRTGGRTRDAERGGGTRGVRGWVMGA